MSYPKRQPGERAVESGWTHVKVEPLAKWRAWIAGEVIWVETHHLPPSKPCREAFTDGAVPCQIDHTTRRLEWSGYLPLWDANHKATVIIIREYQRDVVAAVPRGREVLVTKGPATTSAISVLPTGSSVRFHSTNPRKMDNQDIRLWLLTLWKDQTLKDWVATLPAELAATSPGGVAAHAKPRVTLTPEQERELSARVVRGNFVVADAGVDEQLNATLESLARKIGAERNGVHRKGGG